MFKKISDLFQKKPSAEQIYLQTHQIRHDPELGYIIDDIVLNELNERLSYFSNRKVTRFDDLENLFYRGMLIKEKIDLELNTGRFTTRLGNNQQNLEQLKKFVILLNDYYREFKRER